MESDEHPWASLESSPQPLNTMSLLDLSFNSDASIWLPPTQEGADAWADTAETPFASLDLNSAINLGLDQGSLWSFSNVPCSNLSTEDSILYPLPEWTGFDLNGLSSVFPDSSSTESQGPSPWDSFSGQSPCSESLNFSPTSSELLYAPPTLRATPTFSEVMIEDLVSPIQDYIQGLFPSEAEAHPVSRIPERRPNISHSQQTSLPRPKARDRRKKELPEKCPVCQMGHQYRSSMERHICSKHQAYALMHGIVKGPNICEPCGKRYARSDHLYRHGIQIHGWPRKKKY